MRAAPNGSTLLVSVNTLVMNRSLYPKLPFDPVKDLVPVSLTSWGQLLLVASPNTGYKSAAELIAAAKSRPGSHQLRQPGRRHAASPVDGTVQVHSGHFPHPYPLSRHGARGHRPAGRPGRGDVPADPRGAAACEGRQAGGAGHRQRQAPCAAARCANPRRSQGRQRQRGDVVRHLCAARHFAGVREPPQPRAQGHPGHTRSSFRIRDAGHGPRHQQPRGVPPPRGAGCAAVGRADQGPAISRPNSAGARP